MVLFVMAAIGLPVTCALVNALVVRLRSVPAIAVGLSTLIFALLGGLAWRTASAHHVAARTMFLVVGWVLALRGFGGYQDA